MKKLLFIVLGMWSTSLFAQEETVRTLTRQLDESRTKFPAMRPQVFFSQDKYAPGDTAFFRLFILTESERILAERSLLTLELIHPNGQSCARQAVTSQRFGAANQLILPDSLTAGLYQVRLFSDKMTLAYGLSTPLLVVGEKRVVKESRRGEGLVFFPEGGHLVTGALNRMVIRAAGKLPASATLLSDEGRIMSVDFNDAGLAEVQFVPQRNRAYQVEYVIDGRILHAPVPATDPTAIALRIYRGPKKTFVLDLSTGPKGPRLATLFLIGSRQILHSQEVRFKSDRANILAADGFFPEGFSEVFVLDNELNVLAYRPMYMPLQPAANLTVSGLPSSAALRQDVKVDLKLSDAEGRPVVGGLAIAVVPEEVRLRPLRTPDPTLEFRPVPPSFDWTLPASRIDQEIIAAPIPKGVVPEFPRLLHRTNLTLTGRAYSKDRTAPLPYLSRMVIYLHKDLIQYETSIDGEGNFEFSKIYDFLGADKVFFKVVYQGKTVPHTAVNWSTSPYASNPDRADRYVESNETDAYGVLRKRKQTIDRSFNYFLSGDTVNAPITNYNDLLEKEFRGADIAISPGEYVPFETMRELILEVIPSVKFRIHGKDSLVQVDLRTFSPLVPQRYPEDNALLVIDGYLTTNINFLMALSPKDILSVKIIQDIDKLNRLENLGRDGVLFIQTRIPERTRRALEKELHDIEGLSPTLTMATRYPVKPRVPDLRSLLYWTPLADTDSTGSATFSFRTSDMPGAYWVRIMGTTATGHLVTAEQRFVVNFK